MIGAYRQSRVIQDGQAPGARCGPQGVVQAIRDESLIESHSKCSLLTYYCPLFSDSERNVINSLALGSLLLLQQEHNRLTSQAKAKLKCCTRRGRYVVCDQLR